MTFGPINDVPELALAFFFAARKGCSEGAGFVKREIGQFNTMSYVEGCAADISDEIRWACYAEQDKAESPKLRLRRASIVARANGGKEVVRKGKTYGSVDFVDEDNKETANA